MTNPQVKERIIGAVESTALALLCTGVVAYYIGSTMIENGRAYENRHSQERAVIQQYNTNKDRILSPTP